MHGTITATPLATTVASVKAFDAPLYELAELAD
jgi:hypothetical protein